MTTRPHGSVDPARPEGEPREHAGKAAPPGDPEADLQSLLGRAVERLARMTSSPRVAAWGPGREGRPIVLAARIEGAALHTPTEEAYRAAVRLQGPCDLGSAGLATAVQALGEADGFAAIAPIRAAGALGADPARDADALLLLGGEEDPPGRVRPRTLAALAAAAERLQAPIAVALASERFRVLDQDIRQLDRLASLGGLVAEIVHEIRNPLVSIKTFLQLLPERESDPDFTEGFLDVAREELQRIERLLNLVLEHGRPQRSPRSAVKAELDGALDSVLQLVRFRADERHVTVASEIPSDLPKPGLGADGLRQALLNLTLNAIEASPEQGTVTIHATVRETHLEICVDDEGSGVPPERRADLLTPFYSTKSERPGGLGLSITARILEEAGGRLHIEDAPSGGARFRLSLPS